MGIAQGTRERDQADAGGDRRLAADRLADAILLARAGRELAATLDYQATLQRVVDLAAPAVADWAIVYTLAADGGLRRAAVAHADPAGAPVAEALRRYR